MPVSQRTVPLKTFADEVQSSSHIPIMGRRLSISILIYIKVLNDMDTHRNMENMETKS